MGYEVIEILKLSNYTYKNINIKFHYSIYMFEQIVNCEYSIL